MSKTIINTRNADLKTSRGVRLRPGENVMDADKARQVAESPEGQTWFSLGWIGVKPAEAAALMSDELDAGASDDVGSADTDAPAPMSAKEAISFVDAQADASVLEGMLMDETRKTVTAAIERRLEELSPASEAGESDDEGPGSDDGPGDSEG